MSEASSDTESSCGWTIISNEGSDIETLGAEAAVECGTELLEHPPVGETKLGDAQAPTSTADCVEEEPTDSRDETLVERTINETLYQSEDAPDAGEVAPVALLSSSDHSDIVTLNSREHVHVAEGGAEEASDEDSYLGTPCSSQYTFTPADTGKQPEMTTSSSSEDEEGRSSTTAVRRRRLRKNTTSVVTEDEELDMSQHEGEEEEEEEEEDAEQLETQTDVKASSLGVQNVKEHKSSVLNKCVMVALIIALSMGFGHFHGTIQVQERQKPAEKIRLRELDGVKDLLQQHVEDQTLTNWKQNLNELEEQVVISLLAEIVDKLQKENQKLSTKQAQIQAQRDFKIRELEAAEAGADSLLSENQKLKDQLEEEKQLVQNFQNQNLDMQAEAQTLRVKFNQEKAATDELQTELNLLKSHIAAADEQSLSEAEGLQTRVKELENRLHFEQQRSDMWERLYVETKEERAKGDSEPKVKKRRSGVPRKVKETFDAVKNSTKEFVYYHKEQIKKAKEVMKENIRRFSDSVKSTFRNFKDSASTLLDKARGFYDKKNNGKKGKDTWQPRPLRKASHQFQDAFQFQSSHKTRKSGESAEKDPNPDRSNLNGCSGVFDCAYQESMSLFNEAMEPIKADEFHQLLRSYLQQEAHTFHHWKDLEVFISSFFNDGVFVHDLMLFTDFVSDVGDYLTEIHKDEGSDGDVFRGFEDYIYRHFFGEAYMKTYHPNGPFQGPEPNPKESRSKRHYKRQQRAKARPRDQKWSRSKKNAARNIADVKIELGPMPFDPKY
eukprot:XP_003970093.1 PREDICTED: cell cycle progression protein 1 [Takifugu rubripes]